MPKPKQILVSSHIKTNNCIYWVIVKPPIVVEPSEVLTENGLAVVELGG